MIERQQITKTIRAGNQRKTPPSAKPAFPTRAPASPLVQIQRNLGNEAFGHIFQAKLEVNQPGDVYEQEADRVVNEVMRMPEPGLLIQATEKPEEEKEETFQAKEVGGGAPVLAPSVERHINGMRTGGQPLPQSVRAFFEPRFGCGFSQVRVHTDAKAAESARAVNALAYTVGQDVVFEAGRYEPGTSVGKRLLAHELTHVVQQGRRDEPALQRYVIEDSCRSSEPFPAEQRGNMRCQNGTYVQNGTVYNLSYATLPNRCPDDRYSTHSAPLIDAAAQRARARISSSSRPEHCLREEEFQRGVLNVLQNMTIRCERDRTGPEYASILSEVVHLRHGSIHGEDESAIESLAGSIFHEALHIWEGRWFPSSHTGIVTPCTAACFPDSGQAGVDREPSHCIMPPLERGASFSAALQAEATRGGGVGAALSFRRHLFTVLRGHLTGQLGLDLSYEHLFSAESQRRYGSDLLRLTPTAGLTVRPGILDRKGLVFNLEVGPTLEIGSERTTPGFRFNLGAGLEFDFLYLGGGIGTVVPLSSEAETTLDFTLRAAISF